MFGEAKIVRLGQIVMDLKKETEELQAHAILSTLPVQITEHINKMEDATTHVEDCEKMAKVMVEETTHFWMSVV